MTQTIIMIIITMFISTTVPVILTSSPEPQHHQQQHFSLVRYKREMMTPPRQQQPPSHLITTISTSLPTTLTCSFFYIHSLCNNKPSDPTFRNITKPPADTTKTIKKAITIATTTTSPQVKIQ